MDQPQCPFCQSRDIEQEVILVASDQLHSLGRSKLKFGIISGLAAIIFGLLCIFAAWHQPHIEVAAIVIVVLSFLFAFFILAATFYYSRWHDVRHYHCRDCRFTWMDPYDLPSDD